MPAIPILVEGDTDAAFFANLIQRMSLPEDIQFETRSAEGRGNLPDLAKALASGAFERFVIAQDLDRQTSQVLVTTFESGTLPYPSSRWASQTTPI